MVVNRFAATILLLSVRLATSLRPASSGSWLNMNGSTEPAATAPVPGHFDPSAITRPHRILLKYYGIVALFTGPFAPITFLPLFFKYETLKYKFDDSGVTMSWGILFRRETYLTYQRIQDIHLTRNIIQRWMGLATVSIQTASGSAGAEMTIEGLLEAEQIRDFLYSKMRGAKGEEDDEGGRGEAAVAGEPDEALQLLREIRDRLQDLVRQRGAP
jgi:uncharacterized protein